MAPRTTTDVVFEQLHEEILSLKIMPGARISEAEVARRMGVSRQPVRDAFNRLGNLDLLVIRPQRATEVRRFSMDEIDAARFIRLSVELEVAERACEVWDDAREVKLRRNLNRQEEAVTYNESEEFHRLDYDFHKLISELSGYPLAFNAIEQSKRRVDRLCVLSLGEKEVISAILQDHQEMAKALSSGSKEKARAVTRHHLSRLDDTIKEIHVAHSEYFEDA